MWIQFLWDCLQHQPYQNFHELYMVTMVIIVQIAYIII